MYSFITIIIEKILSIPSIEFKSLHLTDSWGVETQVRSVCGLTLFCRAPFGFAMSRTLEACERVSQDESALTPDLEDCPSHPSQPCQSLLPLKGVLTYRDALETSF